MAVVVTVCVAEEERKQRREGEGVSLDGGSVRGGEGGGSSLRSRSQQCTCEGNAFDTMHAWSGIVGCHCREGGMSTPVPLLMGLPGSFFAQLSNVRGPFRQSSWHEDDVLISGRSLRPSLQPLAGGFVVRAYAAEPFSSHTRAMCGVSV